jgi:signal peptidase II
MSSSLNAFRHALSRASIVVLLVIAVDQITKTLTVQKLADGPVELGLGVRLVNARNTGIAFSKGAGFAGVIIPVLAVTALISWVALKEFRTSPRRITTIAYGLILGGAWGNIIDRMFRDRRWGRGAVVDMVDVGWWPVFNVADAALTVGVVTVITANLLWHKPTESSPEPVETSSSAT